MSFIDYEVTWTRGCLVGMPLLIASLPSHAYARVGYAYVFPLKTKNKLLMSSVTYGTTFFFMNNNYESPHPGDLHNIIQIHNNVLWD